MQFASEFEWLSPTAPACSPATWPITTRPAGWPLITPGPGERRGRRLRAVQPASARRRDPQRAAPGRRRPRCPGPLGDGHSPRLERALRLAAVRHRGPGEFFAAVRAEAAERDIWITPQTRDMNPVYTGKDVTYIDTKQAQRAAETAVLDGERLGTLAWLAGADYPVASLDKAWRQLVFGAHHDAITGSEGDQVYLDLLGSWREAWERGDAARTAATRYLAGLADTASLDATARTTTRRSHSSWSTRCHSADPRWPRSGSTCRPAGRPGSACTTTPARTGPVPGHRPVRDRAGGLSGSPSPSAPPACRASDTAATWSGPSPTPALAPDGSASMPRSGWRTTRSSSRLTRPAAGPYPVLDKRSGTELLQPGGGGNELVLQPEHPAHPRWAEGPWLLCPAGPGTGSTAGPRRPRGALPGR